MHCETYHLPRPDLDRVLRDLARVWQSESCTFAPSDVIAATVRPVTL
jgi:hypothetical protein